MKSLAQIQSEIGLWSRANFGVQQSTCDPTMILGSLAPLIGMFEELGEYTESVSQDDRLDALGDVLVYLCDYCNREEYLLQPIEVLPVANPDYRQSRINSAATWIISLGRLSHCTLKHHQGIRGFDDPTKYTEHRNAAVQSLLESIAYLCHYGYNTDYLKLLNMVWNKVCQRNWKALPATAADTEAGNPVG